MKPIEGPRCIHAAKRITRDEYESARDFMRKLGIECPPPADLLRGGIIGTVEVTGYVTRSSNPWWFGPRALVVVDPEPCDFVPSQGALGYFKWEPSAGTAEPPAKWMLPKREQIILPAPRKSAADLFGEQAHDGG